MEDTESLHEWMDGWQRAKIDLASPRKVIACPWPDGTAQARGWWAAMDLAMRSIEAGARS